ncbi:hypothetical protein [Nonomuraea maritima]|nr:hypothetical protein [Nonomuraea maritima]
MRLILAPAAAALATAAMLSAGASPAVAGSPDLDLIYSSPFATNTYYAGGFIFDRRVRLIVWDGHHG